VFGFGVKYLVHLKMKSAVIAFEGGDMVAEEKKGRVKVTVEVEINEALMEMLKNMPQMMQMWRSMREQRRRKEEAKSE